MYSIFQPFFRVQLAILLLLASLADLDLLTQSLAYSRDMTLPPALIPKLMDAALSQTAMDEFAQRIASD